MEKRIMFATVLASLMSFGVQAYDTAGVTESAVRAFKEQPQTYHRAVQPTPTTIRTGLGRRDFGTNVATPPSTVGSAVVNQAPPSTTGVSGVNVAPPSTVGVNQAPPSTTGINQAPPSTVAGRSAVVNQVPPSTTAAGQAAQQPGKAGKFGFFF